MLAVERTGNLPVDARERTRARSIAQRTRNVATRQGRTEHDDRVPAFALAQVEPGHYGISARCCCSAVQPSTEMLTEPSNGSSNSEMTMNSTAMRPAKIAVITS